MKRDEKRNLLKTNILKAAENRIISEGLVALRARDIANDAGCSLGSLYNAYQDIDDLILHVNSQTLTQMSHWFEARLEEHMSGEDALLSLAISYLEFAYEHPNRWDALFSHNMHDNAPVPEWYRDKTNETFGAVIAPLLKLRPDIERTQSIKMVRTLFSAVHGIITLYINERIVSITRAEIEQQVIQFVKIYAAGLIAYK